MLLCNQNAVLRLDAKKLYTAIKNDIAMSYIQHNISITTHCAYTIIIVFLCGNIDKISIAKQHYDVINYHDIIGDVIMLSRITACY